MKKQTDLKPKKGCRQNDKKDEPKVEVKKEEPKEEGKVIVDEVDLTK